MIHQKNDIKRVDSFEIVKFQIITYLFINKVDQNFSDTQINCLSWLGILDEIKLTDFCEKMVELKVFKHKQSVRNFIAECLNSEKPLIDKNNKSVKLSIPDIVCNKNLVYTIKLGYKNES
jgi:hypothetical protein